MKLIQETYNQKVIIVTGHTGFKGSWLSLWLYTLGAKVIGLSKEVVHPKGLYSSLSKRNIFSSEYFSDIRNKDEMEHIVKEVNPDYIFHLAAQPIVSDAFDNPILTFHTNAIGTLNLLESLRNIRKRINLVLITSDKCYENVETYYGYKEIDQLGGKDPYSASKACAEIIANCYIRSIYQNFDLINIATARAGNVIGGGDWSKNRLIPDALRAWEAKKNLFLRSPKATRPWQHVLEPLRGYLLLGQYINKGKVITKKLSEASFNFGPRTDDVISVEQVIKLFSKYWPNSNYSIESTEDIMEASLLNLSYDKASNVLGWRPKMGVRKSLEFTANWYLAQSNELDMVDFSIRQINIYNELS